MKNIGKIILLTTILCIVLFLCFSSKSREEIKKVVFKGFGWYGYLSDDEINEERVHKIIELGGNAININVYYEYDLEDEKFILLSNLTKIKEKIGLAHKNGLMVFVSPFANLIGGHYTANAIQEPKNFLNRAKNISIELAEFSQKNRVEVFAVWNELGLAFFQLPNSIDLTNKWLQETKDEVRRVYKGILTTKEGVQVGLYENYNFSGYDCIGLTFYPFTTSSAQDPYTNFTYGGVESLKEYEEVVRKEFDTFKKLENKFDIKCVILGEIGIDVVGGKFIGNDDESKGIRVKAYEMVLKNGVNKIDGFFFGKFDCKDGGSENLDYIFKDYFYS